MAAAVTLRHMSMMIDRAHCEALDTADPLRHCRERFRLPPDLLYLDGNSLGALPRDTPARLAACVEQEWGEGLIRSWNSAGWVDAPQRVGDKLGRLIGAAAGETLIADSTSVNLYKLLAMALALRPQRSVILADSGDFPTDQYIAQGLIAQLGGRHQLRRLPPDAAVEDYEAALDERVAVLMLSHVNYRSGALQPMRRLNAKAHAAGALTLWDLAHSAGAVPLSLAADDTDFAVGCGYKYLNGGPGAPAFLYIAQRWQGQASSPLTGWFGHARPFAFESDYRPAVGITQALCGTPAILGLTALEAGLDTYAGVDIAALRAKSVALGELFLRLVAERLAGHGFGCASPADAQARGSQISLRHAQAWSICQALIAAGVIGDFRAPDVLRFGFTPLYVGYADIWDAVDRLQAIMTSGEWRDPRYAAPARVT